MIGLEATQEVPSSKRAQIEKTVSVMVIDDDADGADLIALLLQRAGYTVATARNGAEGLVMLERIRPQLILLDVHMPIMDGPRFREAQRHDPALLEIPTVVMSSDPDSEMVLDPGITATIKKPASIDAIMDLVEQHCHAPGD
ncbi:MAG: response regulator [Kofleriaceae bacterium]